MFRKNRTEDYDEYNERVNAKYDDDYVREEKEYRDECTHSHEQSYDDYNYVRGCEHEHGQTYDDYTSVSAPDYSSSDSDRYSSREKYSDRDGRRYSGEERQYSEYAQTRSFFNDKLLPNESMIYTGEMKGAELRGCGLAIVMFFLIFFFGDFIIMLAGAVGAFMSSPLGALAAFAVSFVVFIIVIISVLRKLLKRRTRYFCITDKRLLMDGINGTVVIRGLTEITDVSLSAANSAYGVSIIYKYRGVASSLNAGNDTEKVYHILSDAVRAARRT